MVKIIINVLLLFSMTSEAQQPMFHGHNQSLLSSRFLDLYPGAAIAYSLRRLGISYGGSAIQVQKSSNNATLDIGFTANGDLDTASLKTFIGVTDTAYVLIWYDQSGAGINMGASGTTRPRIMKGNVIERQGANPSVFFNGTGNRLTNATGINCNNTDWSTYIVQKRRVAGVDGALLCDNVANGILLTQYKNNNFYIQAPNAGSILYKSASDATALFSLIEGYLISTTVSAYKNSTSISLASPGSFTTIGTHIRAIGSYGSTNSDWTDGDISEIIHYSNDQSANRTGILANINSYYTIY